MAFNFIQKRLEKTLAKVREKGIINQDNIKEILDEIKIILLDADVNLKVVNEFLEEIKSISIGQIVDNKKTSSQVVLKIINDQLIKLLGKDVKKWVVKKPNIIMLVGLQGSGKTTSSVKIAKYLTKKQRDYSFPLLLGLDIYRPAAIKQLQKLAIDNYFDFYSDEESKNVEKILKDGLQIAKQNGNDLIIIDTAGRLQTNVELLNELKVIKELSKPSEVVLVVDSMAGQEIIEVAKEFDSAIKITTLLLSKFDSEAKGGAALSIRKILNVPIAFVGTGEHADSLDVFYPERMASRLLGLGDIKTLTERTQEFNDEKENERMYRKILSGQYDLDDFLESIKKMQKIGNISAIAKMLPTGFNVNEDKAEKLDSQLIIYRFLLNSMTKKEKRNPILLNQPKRKQRITFGSGRSIQEYNELIRHFEKSAKQMREIAKYIKSGNIPNFANEFEE